VQIKGQAFVVIHYIGKKREYNTTGKRQQLLREKGGKKEKKKKTIMKGEIKNFENIRREIRIRGKEKKPEKKSKGRRRALIRNDRYSEKTIKGAFKLRFYGRETKKE